MLIASAILGKVHETTTVIFVVAIVMCYTGAANALNDIMDYEIDLVNRPLRPIPSGHVQKQTALIISMILFSVGSVLCLQLPETAKVISILIAMPLMVIYSRDLKGKPLIGNITIAFILGVSFLFCGAAHNNTGPMWIPMMLAFGLTLVRAVFKDIAEI